MKVETATVKNEIFMNEEGTHRYLLQRHWGKPNTAIVAIITLRPVSIEPLHQDLTLMLIQNHVADMGYSGFVSLNLVSEINQTNKKDEDMMDVDIEDELFREVLNKKEVQQIIIACGSAISKKGVLQSRLKEILNLLTEVNKEKVVAIVNDEGQPIHPLVPSIRSEPWKLSKVKL